MNNEQTSYRKCFSTYIEEDLVHVGFDGHHSSVIGITHIDESLEDGSNNLVKGLIHALQEELVPGRGFLNS